MQIFECMGNFPEVLQRAKVALIPPTSQPPSDFYLTATNVDDPQEVAYYTTATLPSGASLRRSAYNLAGWSIYL